MTEIIILIIFFILFFIFSTIMKYFLSHKKIDMSKKSNIFSYNNLFTISLMIIISIFVSKNILNIKILYSILSIYIIISIIYSIKIGRPKIMMFFYLLSSLFILIPQIIFSQKIANYFIYTGLIFIVINAIIIYKNPYYNLNWLEGISFEIAKDIEKNCKYTNKPIIVNIKTNQNFLTGGNGLNIWLKKDRAIIKMSKKFHKKLGSPNMQEFSNKIIIQILDYKNEVKKDDKC
ncbi:MAG: hypothetical protein PWP28_2179 [Oceanotoga sp.]|uniref:hypothetical protein n=1 Tax=Oceanotoga sp. TaxID=2108366 RepID=UPI0026511E0C|nr:hypothetical protein [Oceanotoga sp.]MDN5343304.1 hypothetical protein [Oceanotoga sp.]